MTPPLIVTVPERTGRTPTSLRQDTQSRGHSLGLWFAVRTTVTLNVGEPYARPGFKSDSCFTSQLTKKRGKDVTDPTPFVENSNLVPFST